MFRGFFKKLAKKSESRIPTASPALKLKKSLEDTLENLQFLFCKDDTFKVRRFRSKTSENLEYALVFLSGMVDSQALNDSVIKPLQNQSIGRKPGDKDMMDVIMNLIITSSHVEKADGSDAILEGLLYGNTLLLVDGYAEALLIDSAGWETRAITEPSSEKIVRGPREGFIESLLVNLTLLRRKIQSPALKFQFKKLGLQTQTRLCICYLDGLASEKIVEEVHERLDKIKIDAILDSGYIQELIKDAPYSPFDTVGSTERPDVVAAKLLEGRIAIFVDGSPFVLTIPYLFVEYFQVNEDYYNNFIFASFNRIIRVLGATLTIMVPAVYIAITNYHQELLPTPLLLSIAAARQGVPFPTVIEAILMILTFEILREAGTRIPTSIGQTISIVGALVLGQAAVDARLVSAPIVIVAALTGITSLLSIRLLGAPIIIRAIYLFLGSIMGLFGIIYGFIGLVIHLMSLRSFGVPFMLNIASLEGQEVKDTAFRMPWWYMELRPPLLAGKNRERQPKKAGKQSNAP